MIHHTYIIAAAGAIQQQSWNSKSEIRVCLFVCFAISHHPVYCTIRGHKSRLLYCTSKYWLRFLPGLFFIARWGHLYLLRVYAHQLRPRTFVNDFFGSVELCFHEREPSLELYLLDVYQCTIPVQYAINNIFAARRTWMINARQMRANARKRKRTSNLHPRVDAVGSTSWPTGVNSNQQWDSKFEIRLNCQQQQQ